jgi:hypothetical protein
MFSPAQHNWELKNTFYSLGILPVNFLNNVLTKGPEDPVRSLISVALQHTLLVPEQGRHG